VPRRSIKLAETGVRGAPLHGRTPLPPSVGQASLRSKEAGGKHQVDQAPQESDEHCDRGQQVENGSGGAEQEQADAEEHVPLPWPPGLCLLCLLRTLHVRASGVCAAALLFPECRSRAARR
jgi:hypothetical protein